MTSPPKANDAYSVFLGQVQMMIEFFSGLIWLLGLLDEVIEDIKMVYWRQSRCL